MSDIVKKLIRNSDDLKNLLRDTAFDIQSTAQDIVPKDTRNLMNSIRVQKLKNGEAYKIFTSVEYATHVEYGTRYMRARPYMKPAVIKNTKNLNKKIKVKMNE